MKKKLIYPDRQYLNRQGHVVSVSMMSGELYYITNGYTRAIDAFTGEATLKRTMGYGDQFDLIGEVEEDGRVRLFQEK